VATEEDLVQIVARLWINALRIPPPNQHDRPATRDR
jgi:hypothetical protein